MAAPSFVFKLHYDDGPSPCTRRYGYQGDLALEQVYTGLYERASQVFHLARSDIVLSVRDPLGNPSLALDSFASFVKHVCRPLDAHPEQAKIDEKKRVVLGFVVQSKVALERVRRKAEAKAAKRMAEEKVVKAVAEKVAAALVAQENAAAVAVQKEKEGKKATAAAAAVAAASADTRRAAAEKGYAPAYTNKAPSASEDTLVAPAKVETVSPTVKESHAAAEPLTPEDKAEAWSGVKTLLRKFVRDLNSHLADTFGDDCAPFELSEPSTAEVEVAKEVKDVKSDAPPAAEEKTPVHFGVYCDCCNKTIVGPRYKCVACSNYDTCGECVDARASFHPAHHPFAEIASPHATPVISTRGALKHDHAPERKPEAKSQPQPQTAPAPEVVAEKPKPEPEVKPPVHPATCDVCRSTIVGVRYKCLQCGDWDACAWCYSSRREEVHPHHNFVAVHDPAHLQHRAQPDARTVHRNIVCDGCNMSPLIGVRYHCTHPDCATAGGYDLCAACEAQPIPLHPHDHNLLKIREPLNPFGAGRGVVAQATQRAQALLVRAEKGAEAVGIAALASGPIATLLESLGVHLPIPAAVADEKVPSVTASASPLRSPEVTHAELVDGPGEDMTLVVDVDVSQLPLEQLQGLPAEICVPVALAKSAETAQAAEEQKEEATPAPAEIEEGDKPAASEEAASTVAPAPNNSPHAAFVSDITLLDGSVVPAGSEFNKVWALRNTGTSAWPAGTRVVHVSGFSSKLFGTLASRPKSFTVAAAEPGEVAEVQCECKAPEEAGRYMDFWRLATPDGTRFGDRLWVDVTVEAEGDRAQAGSDGLMTGSTSLSSSSFVAPSLNAAGKAASVPPSEAPSVGSPGIAPSSSGFSVPSHLAPSSVAGSEFESVQAGTASRAGSEGVYISGDEDDSSSLDSSESESDESDSEELSSDEGDSADEFVVVDGEDDEDAA